MDEFLIAAGQAPSLKRSPMFARNRMACLAALAVLVLPGGSLIVGGVWLYRYWLLTPRAALRAHPVP